jgi:hypothetical protein
VTTARAWLAAASAWALAACGEASPRADAEVAAELRALRLALAAREQATSGVDALRGQLAALVAAQRGAEARQAELQRELAAWGQRVAATDDANRAAEARLLRERLDELDLALQQQRARQRELEDSLLHGIDRAATRIDGMLERLAPAAGAAAGQPGAGAVDAAGNAAKPATRTEPDDRKVGGDGLDAAANGATPARRGAQAAGSARTQSLWLALAAVGAMSAWWWIRREVVGARQLRAAGPHDGVAVDNIATFERLAASPTTSPGSRGDAGTDAAGRTGAPELGDAQLGAPEVLTGGTAECARWHAALAAEPLVLREPPPVVETAGGRCAVRYWLRPDASAAARLRLRLRLRQLRD